MTLDDLIRVLRRRDLVEQAPERALEITSLAIDSRDVGHGALFRAVRGGTADVHGFIARAVAAGAAAIVAEHAVELSVPVIVVHDSRLAAQALAEAWYQWPARELSLIGITGTNGK